MIFVSSTSVQGRIRNLLPSSEVASRIIATTAVAISAASLCINRRLYHIASARKYLKLATKTQRRRQVMVDLAIGLGLPVLEVVLCMGFLKHLLHSLI